MLEVSDSRECTVIKNLVHPYFRCGDLAVCYGDRVESNLHRVIDNPVGIQVKAGRVVVRRRLHMHENVLPYSPHGAKTKVQR